MLLSSLGHRAIVSTSRLLTPCIGAKLSDASSNSSASSSSPSRPLPAPRRRSFSSSLSKKKKIFAVINAVGVDRPGIVADVTRIITAEGGNVGESHSRLLGGHFSLMMLVEIANTVEGLEERLEAEVEGMKTHCAEAEDPRRVEVRPTIGFAGRFKLSGADNPGIALGLTSVLARNGLTIGDMRTSNEEAPFGGTELFTMEGRAVAYEPLTSNFDYLKIEEELQEMGESMNCDVEFEDVTKS